MSKTIQIRVDDFLKQAADELFESIGLDITTAIRIFLTMSIKTGGIPFELKRPTPNAQLQQSMRDILDKKNLSKPYKDARSAINSMLED